MRALVKAALNPDTFPNGRLKVFMRTLKEKGIKGITKLLFPETEHNNGEENLNNQDNNIPALQRQPRPPTRDSL